MNEAQAPRRCASIAQVCHLSRPCMDYCIRGCRRDPIKLKSNDSYILFLCFTLIYHFLTNGRFHFYQFQKRYI